tara:strand:- start:216 stop:395 length:180 start_codon:yes stop_codon:yes gene_type:complete
MNIAFILFLLGILMIVAGYTNQISPKCNKDIQIKIIPRDVYDEILYNQELVDSSFNDML